MAAKQPRKPRLSLTKAQIQAGLGAELLALCQSVTEDGSLSNDEVIELKTWIEANRSSELPSMSFLAATIERIIADRKVTKDERRELYQAIEAVLPPEARKQAAQQRRVVEAEERAQARAEKEAQKQQEREARDRRRPLRSANFMVAGVHYEGRAAVIRRYVDDGDRVFLARDRQNRYSRNAVEVRLRNGMQIGFVPEDDAVDVAPLLDRGCPHHAFVTKVLTGGRAPIPVVQAYVYRPDAGVEDAVFEADIPKKRPPTLTAARPRAAVRQGRRPTDYDEDDAFEEDDSEERTPRRAGRQGLLLLLIIIGVAGGAVLLLLLVVIILIVILR